MDFFGERKNQQMPLKIVYLPELNFISSLSMEHPMSDHESKFMRSLSLLLFGIVRILFFFFSHF